MAFYPGYYLIFTGSIPPVRKPFCRKLTVLQRRANNSAVIACNYRKILSICVLARISALKNLAVQKQFVRILKHNAANSFSSRKNRPEIIFFRPRIFRVIRKTDMFCRIKTETVRAARNAVVHIRHKIRLERRIFRIHVRKTAHRIRSTLKTVAVICNTALFALVIQVLNSADCIKKILLDFSFSRRRMIWKNVYYNGNSVFFRLFTDAYKFIARSKLVIADFPVRRLIMIIPFSGQISAKKIKSAVITFQTRIHWRKLHRSKTCFCNILHIFFRRLKRPAPAV